MKLLPVLFLALIFSGYSTIASSQNEVLIDRFIENMTAVLTAEQKCGFSVNQTTLAISVAAMGLNAQDFERGGRYRKNFGNWISRAGRLTSTETKRKSFCARVATDLSAFFYQPAVSKKAKSRETIAKPRAKNKNPLPVRESVRTIQILLSDLGYVPGSADGKLGSKTISAIRLFQTNSGVKADGKVSNELAKSLRSEKAIMLNKQKKLITSLANPTQPINKNNSAELVARLQIYLGINGLYKGPNDGLMNQELDHAIQRFQAANRLSVDGQPSQRLLNVVKQKIYD